MEAGNPWAATKISISEDYCTIVGTTAFPLKKITPCDVNIRKSRCNDGSGILVGVAPSDISQNYPDASTKCGWYFYCFTPSLWSGPPEFYDGKPYGPCKKEGECVHTGDVITIVMDTTKGELSFIIAGMNQGVAFDGIPLNKPLVPCVLLCNEGDSIEFLIW